MEENGEVAFKLALADVGHGPPDLEGEAEALQVPIDFCSVEYATEGDGDYLVRSIAKMNP